MREIVPILPGLTIGQVAPTAPFQVKNLPKMGLASPQNTGLSMAAIYGRNCPETLDCASQRIGL